MFNSLFKIVFFIGFILVFIVRKINTANSKKQTYKVKTKSTADTILLSLNGIGMVIPLVYVFSPVLDFANYSLPQWLGWIGAVLFALAIFLLWKSHHDLGHNWTPVVGIVQEHKLVINGVYKYIRHPMYAAHIVWALAQILLLHNWIAGYSFLIAIVPFYLFRVKKEEKILMGQFGISYKKYMETTGRLFPKF